MKTNKELIESSKNIIEVILDNLINESDFNKDSLVNDITDIHNKLTDINLDNKMGIAGKAIVYFSWHLKPTELMDLIINIQKDIKRKTYTDCKYTEQEITMYRDLLIEMYIDIHGQDALIMDLLNQIVYFSNN